MNSFGNWTVRTDDGAEKNLRKIPKKDKERIYRALEELTHDPYRGDTHKLSGYEDRYRRRVGSYRISFTIFIADKVVNVSEVKRRTSTTY